jgi:UDP-N-acetylmuramoyl-tripeptide--D-alanyl-D-alanine ligase
MGRAADSPSAGGLVIPVTVEEAARILGAELVGPGDPAATITSVTADSRTVATGALFVALVGEHVDAHEHVPAAAASGAVAALTRRPVPDVQCVVVLDPLVALGRLARHVVDLAVPSGLQVVGITGSQGKTSTKDLLAQVLESAGPTVAPVGNLNNELGVPLTVTRVEADTRFLVAEMGARGIGHIAYLCGIAPPRVAVVLNVGQAHVGEFGGQAAIAQAKGELVEALPADGVSVLNVTDPLVWAMRSRSPAPVLAWSADPDHTPATGPALWAAQLVGDSLGRYAFTLRSRDEANSEGQVEVKLRLTGRHQVANAVAAAAAAVALGVGLEVIGPALSAATPRSRWRMEVTDRDDGVTVVNDAYNANPDSVRAALTTLGELGRAGARRTWAVLGDMLELGDTAATEHTAMGAFVAGQGIDRLLVVGQYADQIAAGARSAGMSGSGEISTFADKTVLAAALLEGLRPGDVVLVKASRGLALNTVADEILRAGARPNGVDPA